MVHPEKEIVHLCKLYRHNVFRVYDIVSEDYINIMFTAAQLRCNLDNPFNKTYHNLTVNKTPFYASQLKFDKFSTILYQNQLPDDVSECTNKQIYYHNKRLNETSMSKLKELKPEYFI